VERKPPTIVRGCRLPPVRGEVFYDFAGTGGRGFDLVGLWYEGLEALSGRDECLWIGWSDNMDKKATPWNESCKSFRELSYGFADKVPFVSIE